MIRGVRVAIETCTLHSKTEILNPKPETLNPKPQTPQPYTVGWLLSSLALHPQKRFDLGFRKPGLPEILKLKGSTGRYRLLANFILSLSVVSPHHTMAVVRLRVRRI